MSGVQCDQEGEGNLNTAMQTLLLGDNQQTDAIDVHLRRKSHSKITAKNCSLAYYFVTFKKALNYRKLF